MALDRKIYVRIGSLGSDRQADSCCVLLSAAVTDLDARVSTLEATVSNILPTVEAAADAATAAAATATAAEGAAVAAAADATASAASAAGEAARFLLPAASDPTTRDNGDPLQDGDNYLNTTDNEVRIYNGGAWTNPSAATTFVQLTDCPASYAGQAGKFVRVNATEDGLEFAAGGGGGGTVRDWDLTPVAVPATLTLATFVPGFPYTNEGVVSAPSLSLSVPAGAPHVGGGSLGNMPATGTAYWFWKPGAAVGAFALAQNASLVGPNLLSPLLSVSIVSGSGLVAQASGGGAVVVDAAFAADDVALVYVDVDSGDVGVTTSNGDFPAVVNVPGMAGLPVTVALFGVASSGTGSLSSQGATSDLGSGIAPPPGFDPLRSFEDAPLPSGAADGDVLNVVTAGSWAGVEYADGDGAIVTGTSPAAVLPAGTTSAAVAQALTLKLTAPTYEGLAVEVGPGKTFETVSALTAHIAENALAGNVLTVDLYDGAEGGDSPVRLHFPTFDRVNLKANGATTGNVDLGAANVEVFGGVEPTEFFATNFTTTGDLFAQRVKFGGGTHNVGSVKLRNYYANGAVFNTSKAVPSNELWDCDVYALFGSTVVVNADASDSNALSVFGNNPSLSLQTNRPVFFRTSVSSVSISYTGGDLPGDAVARVGAGTNVRVSSLDYGAANIEYAVSVADGGVASIYAPFVTGAGTISAVWSQAPNVPTSAGLIMS